MERKENTQQTSNEPGENPFSDYTERGLGLDFCAFYLQRATFFHGLLLMAQISVICRKRFPPTARQC
jgi:hypothetical protein